MNADRIKEL